MARVGEVQEIVDLIVDHLVDIIQQELIQWHPGTEPRIAYPVSNELHELKQCALVNRAFSFRSQKHLFSTLKVWARRVQSGIPNVTLKQELTLAEGAHRAINNLLTIFSHKPYLAGHLQTIEISPEFGDLVGQHDSLRNLLGVLQSQGNPRNLIFDSVGWYHRRTRQFDYGFQEAIGTHLQSMRCRYLHKVPASFFVKNTRLHSLELESCSGWSILEGAPHAIASLNRPKIRNISLSSSWTVLDSILEEDLSGQPALNFSDLNHLHLVPTFAVGDVSAVQRLLFTAGPSLNELIMSAVDSDPRSYSRRLDLSLCSKLRTARLLTSIWHDGIDIADTKPFDYLLDTLSTIPCPNSLENLETKIYLPFDIHNWRQAHTSLKWEAMDKELHRISSNSGALTHGSDRTFILHIAFYGHYSFGETDQRDECIQACQQFANELINHRFQLTMASNERTRFQMKHSVAVDHINTQWLN